MRKLFTAAAMALAALPAWADRPVRVTSEMAIVYGRPHGRGKKLGTAHRGELYVALKHEGAWVRIWFRKSAGWIHGRHVRRDRHFPKRVVTAKVLNVRAGPGKGQDKVGEVKRGSKYVVVERHGHWRKIFFRGREAWVHEKYIAKRLPRNDHFEVPTTGVTTGRGPSRCSSYDADHYGWDIGAPCGRDVGAAMDGRAYYYGYTGGAGNYVKVSHKKGYYTNYFHLSHGHSGRKKQGGHIGTVGSTGHSTGCHLHFEIRRYGRPLLSWMGSVPGCGRTAKAGRKIKYKFSGL